MNYECVLVANKSLTFEEMWCKIQNIKEAKEMKRLLMSMFLSMVLLIPSMVKADVNISDSDISAVFNESTTSNVIVASALSLQEMEETEGAIWPWVVATGVRAGYGAVGGASSYIGGWVTSGSKWNNRDFGKSIAGGAVGGTIGWNKWMSSTIGAGFGSAVKNYKPKKK